MHETKRYGVFERGQSRGSRNRGAEGSFAETDLQGGGGVGVYLSEVTDLNTWHVNKADLKTQDQSAAGTYGGDDFVKITGL